MAGESWRQLFQAGKETVYGTPVAATRRLYTSGDLTRNRGVNRIPASTGTRDKIVDAKARSIVAGGSLTIPMSADEMIEFLLMGIKGGVTPTTVASTTPTVDPTLTNVGTGGTIPAGVYTGRYTITTPAGESLPKTVTATTTTTGTTSSVTFGAVTPLPAGTTAVTYYLSTPGGAAATASKVGTNANGASFVATAPGDGVNLPPTVAPSSVNTWVFTPGTTVDSATIEWMDAYRAWQQAGVYVNQIRIARTSGENSNVDVTIDLFGKDMVAMGGGLTPALVERVPDFIMGWETQVYVDAFGATPGTTLFSNTLISADLTITNNLGRKYFGDNTTATGQVTIGELEVTGTFVFEANATAYAELQNRDNAVKRVVRLAFGNNRPVGSGTAKKTVMIDIPGAWETVDLTPEDQGTKVYSFTYGYVRDPTNGWPLQVTAINGRATAW